MLGIIDNRFELLARLEHGRGETVYRGRDRTRGQPVLVRELGPDFFDDPESFEFFLGEFDQAAQLAHRAIVAQFYLVRAGDRRVFVISEYVNGISLQALLNRLAGVREACPLRVAMHIALEVAGALDAAHSFVDQRTGDVFSVMHLDICPTTILLSRDGAVKLKGFELSRVRLRRGVGDRPGRLPYRSPERIQGGYLDRRSDQFSLGAVLYQVLAGTTPSPGSTELDIRQRIMSGSSDARSLGGSGTPPGLREAIRRALAPAPDDRFQEIREFAAALCACVPGLNTTEDAHELSALLARVFNAEALCPPQEQSVADPEMIAVETVRRGPQAEITSVPQLTVEAPPAASPPSKPRERLPVEKPVPPVTLERKPAANGRVVSAEHGKSSTWRRTLAVIGGVLALVVLVIAVVRFGGVFRGEATEGAEVASVPSGAEVYLDGHSIGRTPYSISEWTPGVRTLRVEFEGFVPVETTFVVEEDRAPALPVFILGRTLGISSRPPGAEVWIGGAMVSGGRTAAYPVRATDTLKIEVRKAGLASPPPLVLTATGSVGKVDPRRWQIEDRTDQTQMTVTGIFAREIAIAAHPPHAAVYLDGDTTTVASTDRPVELPLGAHRVMLRYPGFLDYTFDIEVTADSPERYTPVLSRYVRVAALGEDTGAEDIGADIKWIRQDETEIKIGDDVQTPYSLKLEAFEHRIMLTRKGYQDTVVVVTGDVDAVTVVMRLKEPKKEEHAAAQEPFGWVRFVVKRSGKPVAEATVFAYDKDKRLETELGNTSRDGELRVKVRPGKYDFYAIQGNRRSKTEGAKIKSDQKEKSITLEFR